MQGRFGGRGGRGAGRGGRGFGRGGRGGTGRGDASKQAGLSDDKLWDRLGKISFTTDLLTLKRACVQYAADNYGLVASVFEKQTYVIEDRPTVESVKRELTAAAQGKLTELMGFITLFTEVVSEKR